MMQMKRYEDWLQGHGRVEQVLAAYRETCSLLIRINDMRKDADRQELHPHILSVAKEAPLELDMEPRLLVFNYEKTQLGQYWSPHELRLSEYEVSGSRLLMVPQVHDVMLRQAEPSSEWFGSLDEGLGLRARCVAGFGVHRARGVQGGPMRRAARIACPASWPVVGPAPDPAATASLTY